MKPLLRTLLLLIAGTAAQQLQAQGIPQQYITEALQNNIVLKEKNVSLDKSLLALREARSLFLPTTWFEAQYTLARGGRSIEVPVGDLLNPVYATLNQLTGSNKFPTISNASEQLNPDNFYDLRIKTTMPVVNPALKINRSIQQQQTQLQQNEIDRYKRELIKDVKTAYFNYLMTGRAISIYQNALQVVQQNLRVNQSLLNNGKGLPAYVTRAASEVSLVESQLQSAQNDQQNARAYFNFLLNKPLTDSIISSETTLTAAMLPTDNGTTTAREELKALSIATQINNNVIKLNKAFRTPRLNAFVDLAAQGFDFKVNNKSFYYLGGIQLQVPIFNGKRNFIKIQQSQLDAEALQLSSSRTAQQLQLAAFVSRNNAHTAYSNYLASLKREEAAEKYFKLIDKGYAQGINPFIEWLDARSQLTNAQLQTNINQYKVLTALTDYERQTASLNLNLNLKQ